MAKLLRTVPKHMDPSRVPGACLPRLSRTPASDRFRTPLLAIAALMLLAPLFAHAGVIHVDASAAGADNGSSWSDAYTDLQDALAGAVSGDEIWVAAGLYKPNDGTRGATFQLNNGVEIYGGFAGTENQREQRDWHTNVTVLSGDIDDNDTIDANGVVVDAVDIVGVNSFHVVTGSGTNSTAILDGFVITAGLAETNLITDPCGPRCGGGMSNVEGSPTLANIAFSGNHATDSGGGLANINNSSPSLTHVSFSGNRAGQGGGMYNASSSSPTLTNVRFSGNNADVGGGIANLSNSSPTLANVHFSGNRAEFDGGGIFNSSSSPTLTNARFSDNLADRDGGGMFNAASSPTLTHVRFSGNRATGWAGGMVNIGSGPTLTHVSFSGNLGSQGGAMYNDGSSPNLNNVSFSGNRATGRGGGMVNVNSSGPTLTSISFSGNRAGNTGGGMFNNVGSNPVIRNTIFWNNRDNSGTGTATASISNHTDTPSTPQISYSLVQGCNPSSTWTSTCGSDDGTNLEDANPLFINTPDPATAPTNAGNLRLQVGSPAIDAGNDAFIDDIANATDLDGNPRKVGDAVDLGAYEYFERPDLLFDDRFEAVIP